MLPFHDHFSAAAANYSARRPTYPPAFIAAIADCCPNRDLAWDVGTGNGQSAVLLADHFQFVVATDASAAQIAIATPHPRVQYRVAFERESGLASGSVDLVTVAQALHWFDVPAFYAEVNRVLKPDGRIAVWSYGKVRIDDAVDPVVEAFYIGRVGRYWPTDRRHVENGYRDLDFPFDELPWGEWSMQVVQTRDEFLGYVETWSAVKRCRDIEGADPIPELAAAISRVWPDAEQRTVSWPLTIRLGCVRNRVWDRGE